MITFKTYLQEKLQLTESYKNIMSKSDKEKYVDEVLDILQSSYKDIGGIKTPSFMSREAAIEGPHMWKLVVRDGKVIAVNIYKDDGTGRKSVLAGTDGSVQGKREMAKLITDDVTRSYTEISDAMEKFVFKRFPELANKYKIPNTEAIKHLQPGEARIPEDNDGYHYDRKIGGSWHTKIMLGTPGKTFY